MAVLLVLRGRGGQVVLLAVVLVLALIGLPRLLARNASVMRAGALLHVAARAVLRCGMWSGV